jgi:hypothetical protein
MSNYESQPGIDDELLSAYLDDELSPEERGAVEARLADDPAARDMLHQLRAVSQAVQGLPQEIVGHDLGSAVLQRVDKTEPAHGDDSSPKFSIGRTRRGWVWASLAVAAALLVMAFQSDREANNDLPAVAFRDESLAKDRLGRSAERGDLEIRPLPEQTLALAPSDAAADDAANPEAPADMASNRQLDELGNSTSAGLEPAMPASEARADSSKEALATAQSMARGPAANEPAASYDPLATTPAPAQSPASTSGAEAGSMSSVDLLPAAPFGGAGGDRSQEKELADVPAEGSETVLVRVLARREALENKAFDQLLARNGIEVDAQAADGSSTPTVDARAQPQSAQQSESETLLETRAPQPPTSVIQDELVLVDAPASAIESSLATLNADEANYLGVVVEQAPANASDRENEEGAESGISAIEPNALADKAGAEMDWRKYNRGIVPPASGSLANDAIYFYKRGAEATDQYGVTRGFDGGYGRGGYGGGGYSVVRQREELEQQRRSLDRKALAEQNLGRALKLRSWAMADGEQAEGRARHRFVDPTPPSTVGLQPAEQQPAPDQAGATSDRVRVLFVIIPADVPASSPPARNKAQ